LVEIGVYSATGELEVGVPQGTARTVKVRARSHGGDVIVRRA
jgi:hypothetical protein